MTKTLPQAQFISLTTYRKSGQAVPTPVWFALVDKQRLFITTLADAGKAKRIRHTPKVELAPSDARGKVLGDSITGQAKIHTEGSETGKQALAALRKKYGIQFFLYMMFMRKERVYLEVTLDKAVG